MFLFSFSVLFYFSDLLLFTSKNLGLLGTRPSSLFGFPMFGIMALKKLCALMKMWESESMKKKII